MHDNSHKMPFFRTTFFFFPKKFGGHESFLWGHWYPCFWTSDDVSSGFQSQSGQPYLHLVEAYILHILWDSPLVWHLLTSWQPAWQLSQSLPYTWNQALVGIKQETYHSTGECSIDLAMPGSLPMNIFLFHRNCISQSHGMAGNCKAGGFQCYSQSHWLLSYQLFPKCHWQEHPQKLFPHSQLQGHFSSGMVEWWNSTSQTKGRAGNHEADRFVNHAVCELHH